MLKRLSRLSLAFVVAFTSLLGANALAQQAQPDRYVVVTYIKVLPGQEAAYRAYLTTTAKKVYQELMAGIPASSPGVRPRTMYQGMEHGSDFDFVGAAVYAGAPPEPGATASRHHEGRGHVAGGSRQEARNDADHRRDRGAAAPRGHHGARR